jgi:hypothetical protein
MTTAEPPPEPPELPRARRPSNAPTVIQMQDDDSATVAGDIPRYDPDATILVAPSSRRTPVPERINPRASAAPPIGGPRQAARRRPPRRCW